MTAHTSQGGGKPVNTTAASETLPAKYLPGQGCIRKINPEFVALWEPYLDEGMGYKHVAEVFGVGKDIVRKHYPGKGWTHEQVSEHGTFMKHHNEKMRKAAYV